MDPRATQILQRLNELAQISEVPGQLTRTYCSPAMRRAHELVSQWLHAASLQTRVDAIGNLIGRPPARAPRRKTLLLGSHLDTVRNAGKFDGPLGVLLAIACVEEWRAHGRDLPFDLAVIGFADEEGVRFQTTYLGSRVVAGTFDRKDLARRDAAGVSLRAAIAASGGDPGKLSAARWPAGSLVGYLEAHLEQGPVLEQNHVSVGVVTSISGQSRLRVEFIGRAGHAGTTPMNLRADALCAAAEFVLAVETYARKNSGLVATVGVLHAGGASNVIPGLVTHTLDVRHQNDAVRRTAVTALHKIARQIAARRKIKLRWQPVQQTPTVPCSPALTRLLAHAVRHREPRSLALSSGAGHDAAVMAGLTPTAMLFLRCKNGLSHHPAESVKPGDIAVALDVMIGFIRQLARQQLAISQ
jgi:allantoate deiminase